MCVCLAECRHTPSDIHHDSVDIPLTRHFRLAVRQLIDAVVCLRGAVSERYRKAGPTRVIGEIMLENLLEGTCIAAHKIGIRRHALHIVTHSAYTSVVGLKQSVQ